METEIYEQPLTPCRETQLCSFQLQSTVWDSR